MLRTLSKSLNLHDVGWWFLTGALLIFLCLSAGLLLSNPFFFFVPPAVLFGYWILVDYKQIFWLVLMSLPLCVQFELGGGSAADLPTEPLMIASMLVSFFYLILNREALKPGFIVHPIFLFLLLHLVWILVCVFHSVDTIVSLKFFLAKMWYVFSFVFLAAIIIRSEEDFKKAFWFINVPLCIIVITTLYRHYQIDFSFGRVNKTMWPFFRNHVNYAVMLVAFLPYAIRSVSWYKPFSATRLLAMLSCGVLILGIVFSYTRAAQISLLLLPIVFFAIRKGAMRWLSVAGLVLVLGFVAYMAQNNRYMDFAIDYHKTRFHDEGFASHLEATIKGRDISSNERIYRWIAGVQMFDERPISGFGPGNFYPYYFGYTVSAFSTYVSDNPERSTAHNYFLLVLVEQGIVGFLFLIVLIFSILFFGQGILSGSPPEKKDYVALILTSFVICLMNLFLSDLVETPKVGIFFFIPIALLINQELENKRKRREEKNL